MTKSFIYEDDKLLRELYRIAQTAPGAAPAPQRAVNTGLLETTVNQMIDGLRSMTSPVQATQSPQFSDLVDLAAFTNWLRMSGAAVNGKGAFGQNDEPNKDVIAYILTDLRNKSTNTNPVFTEAINNVIEQANSSWQLNVKPYVSANAPPAVQAEARKKGLPGAVVPVSDAKPEADAKSTAKANPEAGAGELQKLSPTDVSTLAGNLGILNGQTVNLDTIVDRAVGLRKLIGKGSVSLADQLLGPVQRIQNSARQFDTQSRKSPNIGEISVASSSNESTTKEKMSSAFSSASGNAYTSSEMSAICISFMDVMQNLSTFYTVLATHPDTRHWKSDFQTQIDMCNNYARLFRGAADLFLRQRVR